MPLESVKEMLNLVMQELDDFSEGGPLYRNGSLRNADSEIKHSTPSPTKYSLSPNKSYKVGGEEMSHSTVEYVSVLNVLSTFCYFFSILPKHHLHGQKIKILY